MNELAIIEVRPATELFAPGAIRSILDCIKAEVLSVKTDATTESGRKEIASLAYKVAKTKVALDDAGKKLTEDARNQINAVNEERRIVREELDALKESVRRPLTEYEDREKARVAGHEARVESIAAMLADLPESSAGITEVIRAVEAIDLNGLEEFSDRAEMAMAATLHKLGQALLIAKESEAKAAREAAEAAERARIAREAREKEIAEQARLAAEKKAAEEAKRAEAAREAERLAESERLASAERAREAAEKRAIKERERAEQEKKAAEERHRLEIAEAEARARREAAEQERARLVSEAAEKAAAEKKAANKRHQEAVRAAAIDSLTSNGIAADVSAAVVALIDGGKVSRVSINY